MNRLADPIPGSTTIAEDVLCALVALATLEVRGVAGMSSNLVDGLSERLGLRNLSQGIRLVASEEGQVAFHIYIIARYGYRIPDVALRIQERVKTRVEAWTYYQVQGVHVHVQDLQVDELPRAEVGGMV